MSIDGRAEDIKPGEKQDTSANRAYFWAHDELNARWIEDAIYRDEADNRRDRITESGLQHGEVRADREITTGVG